jgi:hypothetical protein
VETAMLTEACVNYLLELMNHFPMNEDDWRLFDSDFVGEDRSLEQRFADHFVNCDIPF